MNRLYDFLILKYTKRLQIFKATGYALMEKKQIGKKIGSEKDETYKLKP